MTTHDKTEATDFGIKVFLFYLMLVLISPVLLLGWVVDKVTCALGMHLWFYRELLHVPYYGTGHWQCLTCERVKVKP